MGEKNWIIRKADRNDAKGLGICMELAYSNYLERMQGETLPPMEVDYDYEIVNFPVWVVEFENEIAGGLILIFEDDYVTIANIAVRPDFQCKGLGRALMDFAEVEAKSKGYFKMRLVTHVLLTENILFYIKLGWIEINRDDIRVYMEKNL